MKRLTYIPALLFMVTAALSCSDLEVTDHSFAIGCDMVEGEDSRDLLLVITLTEGNPDAAYRMTWTVDGREDLPLFHGQSRWEQGKVIRWDRNRRATFGLGELDMGDHDLQLEISNGTVSVSRTISFTVSPGPFSYGTVIRTANIAVSVLEIDFTDHDPDEKYKATVLVDGNPVVRDTLITVPSFRMELGAMRPGKKRVLVRIRDSYRTQETEIGYDEPAREIFLDMVLECGKDRHGNPEAYYLTCRPGPFPYTAEMDGHFEFTGKVSVNEQEEEGGRPTVRSYTKYFRKPVSCALHFDGKKEMIMDMRSVRAEIGACSEPSILSWFRDENSGRYYPDDVVDIPYHLSGTVPRLEFSHENVPGVRLRIRNTAGPLEINGYRYTEEEIII